MKGKNIKKIVSIFVAALLLLVHLLVDPLWMLEYRAQDTVFQRADVPHPDIIVAGIDERALLKFGPFGQWPRSIVAEAISILNTYEDARPAVIAVDILFSETGLDPAGDAALVAAAKDGGNVVMASSLLIGIDPLTMQADLTALSVQLPFDALYEQTVHGLVNGINERDGIMRFAPLRESFEGERFYTFPVVAAKMYADFWGYELNLDFIDNNPETYIRFTGEPGFPGDFFGFSFADIFQPDFDPGWLYGAIVLIGPYAMGMMDHHPVPIARGMPMHGVEIHANVVQVILDDAFKLLAPLWVAVLIVALMLIVAMALGEFLDIRIVLGIFLALGAGYYFAALHVYNTGYVLPILTPLLALVLVFVYQLIYGYILQTIEKNRMRTTFCKYVDPKLVEVLIESGEADSNAVGKKKDVAVVFVDVRGFTTMSEALKDSPETIVEILNEYLELTSTAIFNNGGSVDKFVGDATMALFNGFVPLDDHVFAAVKAAWEMQQKAADINASIKEQHGVEIGFGVGLHCGEAIVGNLGPSFRKDYTAIGDTVNTAARLESNAAKSQVLISSDVYNLVKDRIKAEFLGEMTLKGKEKPVEVYALGGLI
ncbi:MAG: adenylate/guanylate cyclase domain-containing protein [Defluviitaleaceae bacterium]|nr:adenylate/guanylate cyclase domain-containing protein [Defluviitaleaceae bacterium]